MSIKDAGAAFRKFAGRDPSPQEQNDLESALEASGAETGPIARVIGYFTAVLVEIRALCVTISRLPDILINIGSKFREELREERENLRSEVKNLARAVTINEAVDASKDVREAALEAKRAEAEARQGMAEALSALPVAAEKAFDKVGSARLDRLEAEISALKIRKWAGSLALAGAMFGLLALGVALGYWWGARNESALWSGRSAFWASDVGKQAENLNSQGKLKRILDFGETSGGRVAMMYQPDVLNGLLTCAGGKWRIQKASGGRLGCFASQGAGFYLAPGLDVEVEPEKDLSDIAPALKPKK